MLALGIGSARALRKATGTHRRAPARGAQVMMEGRSTAFYCSAGGEAGEGWGGMEASSRISLSR